MAPFFVLCLLSDQTKQLFSKWLYYGIGTMFSMAMLAVMTAIATKVVIAVASAFWGTTIFSAFTGDAFSQGMTSQAMQQGGVGLLMTTLLITVPPMAANFFQGTLGNFAPFIGFVGQGQGKSANGSHYPPGQGPVNRVPYEQSASERTIRSFDSGASRSLQGEGNRTIQSTSGQQGAWHGK